MTASIEPQSPLAAWAERLAAASASPAAFSIRELPFTAQVNLRGDAGDRGFAAAVRSVIGCDLPRAPNTYDASADCVATWLGPDEWLVTGGPGRGDEIAENLRRALSGMRHSATDVSASRTVIEIGGADARLALAKGCPLDMHGSSFAPPRAAQTLLAKATVLIQCVHEAPKFRIFVRSSFAGYLAEWLTDAARECAAARAAGMEHVAAHLS